MRALMLGLPLLAVLASASAGEPVGEAIGGPKWPQFRGNSRVTGVSPDGSVKPPLKLLWSYRTDGDTGAGVTVGGGKVFVTIGYHRDKLYLRSPYYVMEYDPALGQRLRMSGAACGYGGMAFMRGLLLQSGIHGQYGTGGGTCLDQDAPGAEPKKIPTLEDVRLLGGKGLLGTPSLAATDVPLALGDKLCSAMVAGELLLVARTASGHGTPDWAAPATPRRSPPAGC